MIDKRTIAVVLLLSACADRQAALDDEAPLAEPTCMILWADGYLSDGSVRTINNEWGSVASVCLCMTEEERESKSRYEELNDLGIVECERASKLHYDFDSTDCQKNYESGDWMWGVYVARGEMEHLNYLGLTCGGEDGEDTGCSIRERDAGPSPWAVFAIVGLFGVRRRRRIHESLSHRPRG